MILKCRESLTMTKSELAADMKKHFDGVSFITPTQIMAYTGYAREKVRTLMKNVPVIGGGKGKRYHVQDVANMILAEQIKPKRIRGFSCKAV